MNARIILKWDDTDLWLFHHSPPGSRPWREGLWAYSVCSVRRAKLCVPLQRFTHATVLKIVFIILLVRKHSFWVSKWKCHLVQLVPLKRESRYIDTFFWNQVLADTLDTCTELSISTLLLFRASYWILFYFIQGLFRASVGVSSEPLLSYWGLWTFVVWIAKTEKETLLYDHVNILHVPQLSTFCVNESVVIDSTICFLLFVLK